MPIKPGQRLGHYRIERQIGQGGMGAVYLAEDTKLDRKVALKVLPPEVATDAGRLARFQREAKAIAALSHPHIVTIYSVEEESGTHFFTMELVEGESLDRGLPPGGMPLARVFEVGTALADALAAAHEKGIIHRDLKPANVIVTKDGRVKVLDFGLAKLARGTFEGGPAGSAPATEGAELSAAATGMVSPGRSPTDAGLVLGTVPYMSPEQAGGEAVDARTDIFSLGVMLYEMVTGRRPFEGKNPAETISSILRDAPRPVSEARQDAPRHLGRIIDHCLQKEPEARFQTAKDIRNELRALRREVESGASAVTSHPSAVAGTLPEHPVASASSSTPPAVPVSTTSGATARASGSRPWIWMVAGAAIIIALGAALWFGPHRHDKAGPSRSTNSKPSGGGPAATAVTEAHSIAVLPFVNMSPDKDQEYFSDGISEELLNLLAKVPGLWVAARTSSFSFKGKDAEIPEIAEKLHVAHVLEGSVRKSGNQVRITAQLIRASDGYDLWSKTYHRTLNDIFAMQDEIAADVVKQLKVTLLGDTPTVRKTDPEAYALYLQAVRIGGQGTAEAFAKSDALLKKVLAIDPQYAPAWGHLAYNYFDEPAFGVLSSDEGLPLARAAAAKVLGIDPDYAPAHALLGMIAMSYENDPAAAARHYERALALDPTHPSILADVGTLLQGLGRLQEALAARQFAVARDPVNATAITYLGITELYCGRFDEAIAQFRTALSLSPGRGSAHYSIGVALMLKGEPDAALAEMKQETVELWRMIGLPMVYHALGRKADSDAALAELVRKYKKESAYNIAYVCAFRGEADRAFEWLDDAVKVSDPGLFDIQVENLFDSLHSDPRWLPFLRKIGRAPEQLAKIRFRATLLEDR